MNEPPPGYNRDDPTLAGNRQRKQAPGIRRIRIGDYRVIYTVDAFTITIKKISHRRDVYRRLAYILDESLMKS